MHWFDTREGKMIVGEAAYEDAVVSSGPGDIVPLVDLLVAQKIPFDTSHYDKPRFEQPPTRDELMVYGEFVLNVLAEGPKPYKLHVRNFENLGKLGLGPSIKPFRRVFGKSLWDISEALGSERNFAPARTYDDWDEFDFIENAEKLAASLRTRADQKPTSDDYEEWARAGNGPSLYIIQQRTGWSVGQITEQIGFPNTKGWDNQKYLEWGVNVMIANNGQPLNKHVVSILSTRQRGPSLKAIKNHFGSHSAYQQEITKRYEELAVPVEETAEYMRLLKHIELLCAHFGDFAPRLPQEKLALAARFEVTRHLVMGLSNSETAQIAFETNPENFAKRLIEENYHLNFRKIRSLADKLGFANIVWPPSTHNHRHFYIEPDELAAARQKSAASQRDFRRSVRERKESA